MRAIKISKYKQTQDTNELPVESQEPVAPTTNHPAHTVESWIAETREHKRTQRSFLTPLGVFIMTVLAITMAQSPPQSPAQQQKTERPLTPQERALKVAIATTASFLGQPTNRFKVGQQIPVNITMTNTSNEPVYTCISSDVYQDVPQLTRDGKLVPYTKNQSWDMAYAKNEKTCQHENLPEPVLLKPNEPTVADWLVLADSSPSGEADVWYDTLPVGKYELVIQRRLECCGGPMVESNRINFEVVP
jgi:hypothetical protein